MWTRESEGLFINAFRTPQKMGLESEQEKVYKRLLDARAGLPRPVVGG